ncbi:uncharacterized protein CIMG_13684 [Coccidioides immitis RS]|uniref:Uncharacterized protein n=1 Tax=Coccidioides immitis (strain RS) TaxID=246410 RepID=A0A0D8JVW9_COCIM|nr:uncharacterized protein CIMG_13684 [Coccidioides immitis RS]KJF61457.1 hypothetical protein CIMG_13684 [Coccidioides immitis RS]
MYQGRMPMLYDCNLIKGLMGSPAILISHVNQPSLRVLKHVYVPYTKQYLNSGYNPARNNGARKLSHPARSLQHIPNSGDMEHVMIVMCQSSITLCLLPRAIITSFAQHPNACLSD